MLEERADGDDAKELRKTQQMLDDANEAIEDLEEFYDKVKKEWGQAAQRTIGFIAPPRNRLQRRPRRLHRGLGCFRA